MMTQESVQTIALHNKKSLWKRIIECWPLYLLLLPAVTVTLIFKYIPMYGLQLAFKDFIPGRSIFEASWAGLRHFKRFFTLDNSGLLIWNTFKTAISTQLISFPLPIIFALMINQVRSAKFKKVVQNISYLPYLFSVVVVISITNVFLAPNSGIVNILIEKLGGEQILFFGDDKYVLPIYIITAVWQGLGYNAIIYIAALAGVDQEQMEAARIDGANRFQIIRHIELPAIKDTIVIMFILTCGSLFAVGADKMLLLQTNLNLGASEVISTYVYKVGLVDGQFSFSTAVELFNTVVNASILLIVNAITSKINGSSIF